MNQTTLRPVTTATFVAIATVIAQKSAFSLLARALL